MNPKVDAFLARAKKWQGEMQELRALALACGLEEELKWGKPCYTVDGGNVVLILPFKEHCAFLFPKGALLTDDLGILVQPTENTQSARQARFTRVTQIQENAAGLTRLIREAMAVQKAGLEVRYKAIEEWSVPVELEATFMASPDFKAAFQALTPGRQRGYLLHFSGAKQATTRQARIEKCTEKILRGKGLADP